MSFAYPELLWLLLLAPALLWFLWKTGRRRREIMEQFIHPRLLDELTAGVSPRRQRLRAAMLVAAVILLVLAAARPRWGFHWEEAKHRGLDILIAIDASRSMMAEDIKPNRLERAKLAALELLQLARSDRVGLIAFASTAFLQCPLTMDEGAFRESLNSLNVNTMPQGGTAIAEAINTARNAFTNAGENHRALVLFSDGEDHEAGCIEAAEAAAKAGLKIFTVGLGTPEGETLRLPDEKGQIAPVLNPDGSHVITRLDEKLLREIAARTGGLYVRLTGAKTMEQLYEKGLAPMPKAEHSARFIKQHHEQYHWPLGLAILLLLIEILMSERPMNAPMKNQWSGRAVMLAAFILATACAQAESASAKQAHRYYQDGHYRAAADEYQRLLVKNPNDPRLHYNLGACAFQSGQFDQAAQEFMAATASPADLNLQQNAWYNHGNAMFRLGEKASEIKDRKNHWMAATNSYATALRLNPNDSDAKHNFEIVKKKLEELEQQQQQQSSSDNKDEKDQQQKEQQDKQEQSKNSQSNQQQQNSGQQEQKNQEQQSSASQNQQQAGDKPEQQQTGQQDKQEQAGQNQPQSGTGQTNQTASVSEKGNTNETGQAAQTVQAVMMTPQQAKQLLEAARMEDRILLFMPPEAQKKKNDPHYKNW